MNIRTVCKYLKGLKKLDLNTVHVDQEDREERSTHGLDQVV